MKLGLVAMSGVRAHNAELTKLGLTLPGFVERNKTIASLPSLGLLTLAGLTDNAIELDYREVEDIRKLDSLPDDYDVVAISSFSAQMNEAYELADRFRESGVIVILGGLHVTARPAEAMEHADSIVLGEGEPVGRLDECLELGNSQLERCNVNRIGCGLPTAGRQKCSGQ